MLAQWLSADQQLGDLPAIYSVNTAVGPKVGGEISRDEEMMDL